jgi:hypothetical protein
MNNLNGFSKFILFITCLSGSLWLGSYVTRLSTAYSLFEETDFILKPYYNNGNLSEVFITLLPVYTTTFISYIIFFLFFIIFLMISRISLKQNGWFFITTVLIIATFPFEAYLMTIDWKILSLIKSESFNPDDIVNLIKDRFNIFSSFPVIEIFSYFAIIFLIIFKPLTKETIS